MSGPTQRKIVISQKDLSGVGAEFIL